MDTPQDTTVEHAQRIADFIDETRLAMLVTQQDTESLSGRPLMIVNDEDSASSGDEGVFPLRLTFITNARNNLVAEVGLRPSIGITMQSKQTQCFLHGRAHITRDSQRLKRHWSNAHEIWFEQGVDDPDAVLLDVEVQRAEYWDSSGTAGLRFVIEAGRAWLSGDTVESRKAGRHASLSRDELAVAAD